MLPRLLCEELCSLNPLTDRLTFSIIWKLSPEGKVLRVDSQISGLSGTVLFIMLFPCVLQILSEWFGRSVICSCIKLSYDHAQSMIEAPDKSFSAEELPPCSPNHSIQEIQEAVISLHNIAKKLRDQRFEGGALRLDQVRQTTTHSDDITFQTSILSLSFCSSSRSYPYSNQVDVYYKMDQLNKVANVFNRKVF